MPVVQQRLGGCVLMSECLMFDGVECTPVLGWEAGAWRGSRLVSRLCQVTLSHARSRFVCVRAKRVQGRCSPLERRWASCGMVMTYEVWLHGACLDRRAATTIPYPRYGFVFVDGRPYAVTISAAVGTQMRRDPMPCFANGLFGSVEFKGVGG